MPQVICQALFRPGRLTLLWSEGRRSFEPVFLEGRELETFLAASRDIRAALARGAEGSDVSGDLPRLGQTLHRLMFAGPIGQEVLGWLRNADPAPLEVLSDAPGLVPWQAVCDESGPADWRQCWGVRYALGVGRRVDPQRSVPAVVDPKVVLAIDPDLEQKLSPAVRERLGSLLTVQVVHRWDDLEQAVRREAPDVLAIVGGVQDGHGSLGGIPYSADDLARAIADAEAGSRFPVVLLTGGNAATLAAWDLFVGAATSRLFGVVASEIPLHADQAVEAVLGFVRRFVEGKLPLGEALRDLRAESGPVGLGLAAYAAAQAQVRSAEDPPLASAPSLPLPVDAYRPMAALGRADRPMLFGREKDLVRFVSELDSDAARGIWLCGGPGVGKTSFVRAGVLPFLEVDAVGYRVWRDRTESAPDAEWKQPDAIVRATSDLAGQLARAVAQFAAKPYAYETPTGRHVTVDLPALVKQFVRGGTDAAIAAERIETEPSPSAGDSDAVAIWRGLQNQPEAFAELIELLTEQLPFESVLVVEELEDLFPATRTARQTARREAALRMLASLDTGAGRLKLILSLRTEFLGQILTAFPEASADAWPRRQLEELSVEQLRTIVLAPTSTEPLPYSSQFPASVWRIRYEPGVAEDLVDRAVKSARRNHYPVLSEVHALASAAQTAADATGIVTHAFLARIPNPATPAVIERKLRRPLRGKSVAAFQTVAEQFAERHADGILTRSLASASRLKTGWKGPQSLEDAINALADEPQPLIELHSILIDGKEEIVVTATQDALLRYAIDRPNVAEVRRYRDRSSNSLWIGIPATLFVCALAWFFWNRSVNVRFESERAKMKKIVETAVQLKKESEQAEIERTFAGKKAYSALLAEGLESIRTGNALRARQLLAGQESKTFEWQWVWSHLQRERHALVGQAAPVASLAYAPDGKILASGDDLGVVRLWSVSDRQQVEAVLKGAKGRIRSLAFSADGKSLYVGSEDAPIQVWNVAAKAAEAGKPRIAFEGHAEGTRNLVFLGKDAVVSIGLFDKKWTVWDAETGKAKRIETLKDSATALAAAPDGASFAIGVDDAVEVWDAKELKKSQSWKVAGPVTSLAYAPDGATLAAGVAEENGGFLYGSVRRFDVKSGKETGPPIPHHTEIFAVAYAPKGETLYSAATDRLVRAWDAKTGAPQQAFLGHLSWVKSLAVSPDGRHLASASMDSTIKIWNADDAKLDAPILAHAGGATAVDFAPGDRLLASGGRDGLVKLWNPLDGSNVGEIKHAGPIASLAFRQADGEGLTLAVAVQGKAPEVKAWRLTQDADKGWQSKEIFVLKDQANAVAFDQGGGVLGAVGDQGFSFVDAETGATKSKIPTPKAPAFRALSFGQGHLALMGDAAGRFWIFDVEEKKLAIKPAPIHNRGIRGVGMLAGNRVATVGDDQTLTIRRIKQDGGFSLERLERNHQQPIAFLAPHPDGTTFATGGFDHAIKIWNVEDGLFGAERLTLTGHEAPVLAAAFAHRLPLLVSADHDGKLRFWRAGPLRLETK